MKYLVLARRLLLPLSWGKIPSPSDSFDLREPGIPKRVQRGGSFLSTARYCSRYRVSAWPRRIRHRHKSRWFSLRLQCKAISSTRRS